MEESYEDSNDVEDEESNVVKDTDARNAALEGVDERDHVPANHSTTIDPIKKKAATKKKTAATRRSRSTSSLMLAEIPVEAAVGAAGVPAPTYSRLTFFLNKLGLDLIAPEGEAEVRVLRISKTNEHSGTIAEHDVLVAIGTTAVNTLPDPQVNGVTTRSRLQQVTQLITQAPRPMVLTFARGMPRRNRNVGNDNETVAVANIPPGGANTSSSASPSSHSSQFYFGQNSASSIHHPFAGGTNEKAGTSSHEKAAGDDNVYEDEEDEDIGLSANNEVDDDNVYNDEEDEDDGYVAVSLLFYIVSFCNNIFHYLLIIHLRSSISTSQLRLP